MKKLLYTLLILIPFGFTACTLTPVADFYVDDTEVYIGEEVWFTNDSYNAVDYEWDFGDGTWTDAENPIHTFNASGTYEVVLTAFSRKGRSDEAAITISVLTPTILEIEVLEWEDEYPVPNANVRLYPTLNDWDHESNMVPLRLIQIVTVRSCFIALENSSTMLMSGRPTIITGI